MNGAREMGEGEDMKYDDDKANALSVKSFKDMAAHGMNQKERGRYGVPQAMNAPRHVFSGTAAANSNRSKPGNG